MWAGQWAIYFLKTKCTSKGSVYNSLFGTIQWVIMEMENPKKMEFQGLKGYSFLYNGNNAVLPCSAIHICHLRGMNSQMLLWHKRPMMAEIMWSPLNTIVAFIRAYFYSAHIDLLYVNWLPRSNNDGFSLVFHWHSQTSDCSSCSISAHRK